MQIICLKVGDLTTNCYLAIDEGTGETLVIDPGDEGDFISSTLLEKKLTPKAIILTHGHYDHCLAALELKLNFNLPIYLHPKDIFLYEKAHLSAKHFSHINLPKLPPINNQLSAGEVIHFGQSSLKVIHTPGHTPGSICLYSPPFLFTGDTLFADGVGRTDLSYSSPTDLQKSLKNLSLLSEDTLIYPGHEESGVFINTSTTSLDL